MRLVTFDDNGLMYVWEKRGMVFIVDTDGQRLEAPLVDIREEENILLVRGAVPGAKDGLVSIYTRA